MNGNSLLLDTNIVLYLLNGEETLIPLLEEKNLFISFITQLELLGTRYLKPKDAQQIKKFIAECTIIDITLGNKRACYQPSSKVHYKTS